MPNLGLHGPFNLTSRRIDEVVKQYVPGVFALGYTRESGAFVVRYIGRSDTDVHAELKRQDLDETARFKWAEAGSSHEAFEMQCRLFHDFGGTHGLENDEHPVRPNNTNWPCPVCNYYGR